MEYLVDALGDKQVVQYGLGTQVRLSVLKHLEVSGSNVELAKWFEQNKAKLEFDSTTKKYVVKGK